MTTSTPLDSRERLLDQFDTMVDQGEQLLKTANDAAAAGVLVAILAGRRLP